MQSREGATRTTPTWCQSSGWVGCSVRRRRCAFRICSGANKGPASCARQTGCAPEVGEKGWWWFDGGEATRDRSQCDTMMGWERQPFLGGVHPRKFKVPSKSGCSWDVCAESEWRSRTANQRWVRPVRLLYSYTGTPIGIGLVAGGGGDGVEKDGMLEGGCGRPYLV